MRVFIDTSALVALLDEDDHRHLEAAAAFRHLATTAELVTHNYVEVETMAVVARRLGRAAVERLTDAIFPMLTTLWVDEALHGAALAAQRITGGSASLVDHVSFAMMREQAIEFAFAFDADFEGQGFVRPPGPDAPNQVNEVTSRYALRVPAENDLVSVTEIAARTGRPINTIQSWRRRYRDFPAPVTQLAAAPIWNWPAIAHWLAERPARRTVSRARQQNVADEQLAPPLEDEQLPVPADWDWDRMPDGRPMPNIVATIRRQRAAH